MIENSAGLYAAFKAKDPRFDGRFFVGVSSTGIYCRPVCRARIPKAENCRFYSTAAQAEQAGYRPCLLCRPELAPGAAATDATERLAYRAARQLEEGFLTGQSIEEIAAGLGCTGRHLRRAFQAQYNVSPVQYAQTARLLLSKKLLTDTDLTVLDVAMAAGFGSLRRFNDAFVKHYKLSPTALRKRLPEDRRHGEDITLLFGYRPPYPWEDMLGFLAGRAIAGVELIKDGAYLRTVSLESADGTSPQGWLKACHLPQKNALKITISESLLPVLPQVSARVRHLFDLNCDPDAVYAALHAMNDIRPGLCAPGARVPGCFDAFETAVRAVLGQQITVKAASTLAARIVKKFGTPLSTGIDGLTHAFPSPEAFLAMGESIADSLGELGVISARSNTIFSLAKAISQGEIHLGLCASPEEEIKKLMQIRGIGSWTAQYIAMRVMEWPDAFLQTDAGVKKALPGYTPKELVQLAEAWRPWRSYATINLWNAI